MGNPHVSQAQGDANRWVPVMSNWTENPAFWRVFNIIA